MHNSQPLQRVSGIPPTAKPCHRRNPSEKNINCVYACVYIYIYIYMYNLPP